MLMWRDGSDLFSTAETFKRILRCRRRFFDPGVYHFRWELVWNRIVPSRVAFTVWLLIRGRILTHEGLQLRGYSLASRCFFCHHDSEASNHLFLDCLWAQKLWSSLAGIGFNVFNWKKVDDVLLNWNPCCLSLQGSALKEVVPHAVLWALWNERNLRCFEEKKSSFEQLLSTVKGLVWNWCSELKEMKDLRFERVIFDWALL